MALMMLLRVEAPHFVAGAIWRKTSLGWECCEAAPILAWMVSRDTAYVKGYLERNNGNTSGFKGFERYARGVYGHPLVLLFLVATIHMVTPQARQ